MPYFLVALRFNENKTVLMWVSLNLEMIGVVQFVDCNASLSLWSTLNNLKPPRFIFASLNFCCSTQMFLHFCFWTSDFLLNFQSTCFSFFTLSNGAWIFFFFFFNAEYLDVHANILGPYEILFFMSGFPQKKW